MKLTSVYLNHTYRKEQPYSITASFSDGKGLSASITVNDDTVNKIISIIEDYCNDHLPRLGNELIMATIDKPLALPAPPAEVYETEHVDAEFEPLEPKPTESFEF